MDKRSFLKSSGALLTGTLLSGMAEAETPKEARTNWSGNYKYSTDHLEKPKTLEELQQVVKKCDKLRALGARHSFNRIADSASAQVSLENLESMTVDKKARTVTVGAGVRYGKLAPYLDENGFAVHNLASLPHVTVVGACATATHGSGSKNGNLSTAVSGLEMVTGTGEIVRLSRERDGDRFHGAAVALGAVGVISKITLDVIPRFEVSQVVYENLPFSQLEKNLDEIFA